MKTALALPALAAALALGCAAPRPITWYRPPVADGAEAETAGLAILVDPFRVAPAYDSARITYRTGDAVLGRYSEREWAAAPGYLFGALTAEGLRRHFATVGFFDAPIDADVRIGGYLRTLVIDARADELEAIAAVDFELLGPAIAPALLSRRVAVRGADLAEVIARLGPAYAAVVDELAEHIREAPPAAAAAPAVHSTASEHTRRKELSPCVD